MQRGQTVKIFVRLINLSGGDIDAGRWFIELPAGVRLVESSIPLTDLGPDRNGFAWDPVVVYTKATEYFSLSVFIESTASDRLVFRSFLEDPEDYCEAESALTVRFMLLPVFCLSPLYYYFGSFEFLHVHQCLSFLDYLTHLSLVLHLISHNSLRLKSLRKRKGHSRAGQGPRKASSIVDSSNRSYMAPQGP